MRSSLEAGIDVKKQTMGSVDRGSSWRDGRHGKIQEGRCGRFKLREVEQEDGTSDKNGEYFEFANSRSTPLPPSWMIIIQKAPTPGQHLDWCCCSILPIISRKLTSSIERGFCSGGISSNHEQDCKKRMWGATRHEDTSGERKYF